MRVRLTAGDEHGFVQTKRYELSLHDGNIDESVAIVPDKSKAYIDYDRFNNKIDALKNHTYIFENRMSAAIKELCKNVNNMLKEVTANAQ